jgi:hypothetical protein
MSYPLTARAMTPRTPTLAVLAWLLASAVNGTDGGLPTVEWMRETGYATYKRLK